MGFTDEVGVGGGKPILKFNKEARYVKRSSDEAMNDQEFIVKYAKHAPAISNSTGTISRSDTLGHFSQGRGAAPVLAQRYRQE